MHAFYRKLLIFIKIVVCVKYFKNKTQGVIICKGGRKLINFTIYGNPVAQGRPRATSRGGFIKLYDPDKSRSYKELVYGEAVKVKPAEPLQCELIATIIAYFSIPKSKGKKWKEQAKAGEINPTQKPDADNIAKIILDSCNGILYKDDSQIVSLVVWKKYSENPRVEVKIGEAV